MAEPDPSPRRAQEPEPPFPYDEEQVSYDNRSADLTLAGTLTTPRSDGPHPAALLLTGSGPHDRDEIVLGHRPFLVIADHLTRHGIAVLRVDDRGVGESGGDFASASTDDFASDAAAGVEFLKTRAEIRDDCIGLIGHSDGAAIAAMLAAGSTDVAWIVMLAGPGIPGDELMLSQADLVAKSMGVPKETRARSRELNRAIYAVVKEEDDDSVAARKFEALLDDYVASAPEGEQASAEQTLTQVRGQIPTLLGPWYRSFIRSDPGVALRRVSVPILAINGELDLQVPPAQNLPAVVAALEAGGNRDYAALKLPRLNHLFQTATTGSPAEYQAIEETFAPAALTVITDWLSRHL